MISLLITVFFSIKDHIPLCGCSPLSFDAEVFDAAEPSPPPSCENPFHCLGPYAGNPQEGLPVIRVDAHRIKVRVTVGPDLLRVLVEAQIAASVKKYLSFLKAIFTKKEIDLIQTVLPHELSPRISEKLPLTRDVRGPETFLISRKIDPFEIQAAV